MPLRDLAVFEALAGDARGRAARREVPGVVGGRARSAPGRSPGPAGDWLVVTGAPARAERRSVEPPVPDDPALPGLAVALDPAAALPMLSRAFAPLPITGCRADRVRYRRGARAVVQYSVRFQEASGPRDRWVTALVYPPERAREVLKKLRTGSPSTPTGGIPTVKDDPESKLVLQVFPFDRRLPSLGALTDPEPLVSRLGGPAGEPGTWTAVPGRPGLRAAVAPRCEGRYRRDHLVRQGLPGRTGPPHRSHPRCTELEGDGPEVHRAPTGRLPRRPSHPGAGGIARRLAGGRGRRLGRPRPRDGTDGGRARGVAARGERRHAPGACGPGRPRS